MATIYSDVNGKILSVMDNYAQLTSFYPLTPPAGTTTILDFDEVANATLLKDIHDNISLYTLTGGATPVLKKNGVTQVVTNLIGASTAWQSALSTLNNISTDQIRQILTLLNSGTATLAQTEKAVYFIILKLALRGLLF